MRIFVSGVNLLLARIVLIYSFMSVNCVPSAGRLSTIKKYVVLKGVLFRSVSYGAIHIGKW